MYGRSDDAAGFPPDLGRAGVSPPAGWSPARRRGGGLPDPCPGRRFDRTPDDGQPPPSEPEARPPPQRLGEETVERAGLPARAKRASGGRSVAQPTHRGGGNSPMASSLRVCSKLDGSIARWMIAGPGNPPNAGPKHRIGPRARVHHTEPVLKAKREHVVGSGSARRAERASPRRIAEAGSRSPATRDVPGRGDRLRPLPVSHLPPWSFRRKLPRNPPKRVPCGRDGRI